jgi:hypothetical protein
MVGAGHGQHRFLLAKQARTAFNLEAQITQLAQSELKHLIHVRLMRFAFPMLSPFFPAIWGSYRLFIRPRQLPQ